MDNFSVVVFGDSILKGVITIPNSGKLFDTTENDSLSLAQKELGFELDNRSIYGNITSKGLVKLQKFFEKGGEADFCVIEFGSNDCDYDWNIFAPGAELPPFDQIQPKVPFNDYLKKGDISQNPVLHEGDCLYLTSNHKFNFGRDVLPFIESWYFMRRADKKF